jgi:FHS family Na+ dependent glucose MFS transporter 1
MVGLFEFVMSLIFLGFLCHNPRDAKSKQEEGQGTKKITNRALQCLLIGLMAFFYLLYVGLEVTYGQLVVAFAVHSDLHLAQSTGLVIAVVFWGSFAAMRFASICFSSGFGPTTMLVLNFVFCTVATVLLSVAASRMETALWVGTALLGIGLASVFPTGILWIERYIHISNKVAAAFVMGAALGEMVCPVVVYQLMVISPAMLMHSAVVINLLCIVTFVALRWLALRNGEKYCTVINNGYQLANQEEEEEMFDPSPSGSVAATRRRGFSEHRALLNGNTHRGP